MRAGGMGWRRGAVGLRRRVLACLQVLSVVAGGPALPAAAGIALPVAFGLTFPAGAFAQEPRITTRIDTTELTVGDRVVYSVVVEHPTGSQIVWPDSLSLAPFEILDARVSPAVASGDGLTTSVDLVLTAFELGELEIPSFSVEVVETDGSVTTLDTNPYGLRVNSIGLDEGGEIRDVKGPLAIPFGTGRALLAILATILLPLLAYAIYRRFARRDVPDSDGAIRIPSRPAHETALEALERLERSPLLERGEIKEFHIRVSDILRLYVEERFQVPALELTTRDILTGMKAAGVEDGVQQGLRTFLEPCDLVKFAKAKPGPETSMDTLRLGRTLVEDTIPVVEEVAP